MVVGICQTDVVFGDKKYNLIASEDYIESCAHNGAELVVFPEMSMTGYMINPSTIAEEERTNETFEAMKAYAIKYNVAIGFGYVLFKNGGYTNRYAIVDSNGEMISDYAKMHPFSFSGESKNFSKGDKIVQCNVGGVNISTYICFDLRFPNIFFATPEDTDLIVVAANWPAERAEQWRILLQARAIENQTYVIGINRVGGDDKASYIGGSLFIDPKGDVIDVLDDAAGYMLVDINPDEVIRRRNEFPIRKDRRPELYRRLI